jgi:hypothetical protein
VYRGLGRERGEGYDRDYDAGNSGKGRIDTKLNCHKPAPILKEFN